MCGKLQFIDTTQSRIVQNIVTKTEHMSCVENYNELFYTSLEVPKILAQNNTNITFPQTICGIVIKMEHFQNGKKLCHRAC
jgi:hypothetical protein